MRDAWLKEALDAAKHKADFYSGCRKILRNRSFTIKKRDIGSDLNMPDAGYTSSKMKSLIRGYVHEEARNVAVGLWAGRVERAKYGSVGFHCFNHMVKGVGTDSYWERINGKKPGSKRASVMGPCIQSVSITYLNNKTASVDCFYRTTELFKKFPADLVFIREELLKPFDFDKAPVSEINFHFANVTAHPMYFVTLVPLLDDPIAEIMHIRRADRFFHDWLVKWTARYVCDEYMRGIEKFGQAMRVRKDALERIDKKTLKALQKYLRENHPGYRGDKEETEDGDVD